MKMLDNENRFEQRRAMNFARKTTMFRPLSALAILALAAIAPQRAAAQITINWALVENAGNAPDLTSFGAVSYGYRIGKYEVLNSEYVAFLNAVAALDTFTLYNPSMATDARGGILQAGGPGTFTYSLKAPGYANMPVVFVSFYDALRFANWLQNGQLGPGTTETGTYTFTGPTTVGPRNVLTGNFYALASEDEWYKAAYHQPAAQGGDADNYWLYPTRSNVVPNSRTPPNGADANSGNFYRDDLIPNGFNGGYAVSQSTAFNNALNYLSAGGAYSLASSFYGTFDQGGNVFEWDEGISGPNRIERGGSWDQQETRLRATTRIGVPPGFENYNLGFRVVLVPEPSAIGLIGAGLVILLVGRRFVSR